ncbi:hypothetical protein G6F16_014110 [Rhizopus arrhizus]|nr:hypothetical protein G6F16_014110 [Rhizopus arrhizus]
MPNRLTVLELLCPNLIDPGLGVGTKPSAEQNEGDTHEKDEPVSIMAHVLMCSTLDQFLGYATSFMLIRKVALRAT